MKPAAGVSLAGSPPRNERAQLRRMSQELEGVFLYQLFEAMRATVPQGGLTTPSAGQQMFDSLLDQTLASQAARKMQRGLGEALYRQLSRGLPPESDAESR